MNFMYENLISSLTLNFCAWRLVKYATGDDSKTLLWTHLGIMAEFVE